MCYFFLGAKLHQKPINTKHFERKITQTLTFCYLIDINQEKMTEIYTFYVCGNNGQHSFNIQNTAVQ